MIHLTAAVEQALYTHAREGIPEEVCGILGGERGASTAERGADLVTTIRRVANVADDPRSRYELDPAEQLRAMEDLEARRLDVVGFYHSHPRGPDSPSQTDERQATWPDRVYLIVSLADGREALGAWRWTGEAFDREEVVVSEP